jgi:hypothetical protein
MKFSEMMGKRDRDTTEVTEPELPPEARAAPPLPDAPIRFGSNRSELDDAAAAFGSVVPPPPPPPTLAEVAAFDETAPNPLAAAAPPDAPAVLTPLSIRDVVAELAPRPANAPVAAATVVTDQQLDASAWLDGINDSIDDDLLPH